MRNLLTIFMAFLLLLFTAACGQSTGSDQPADSEGTEQMDAEASTDTEAGETTSERKSPPQEVKGSIDGVSIALNYGSPSMRGRNVWGALVPYGVIWRTGANEATTIEFSADVLVEGQSLPAGKYGLFTVPNEDSWTIIFNKNPDQWGSYDYDQSEDALRVEVTPEPMSASIEAMEFVIDDSEVILRWDELAVPFEVAAAGGGD